MDRKTFDQLEIIEQINHINEHLNQNNSLTKIAKDIGIGRSTVSERFKKEGYIFDKKDNNYIYSTKVIIKEKSIPVKQKEHHENNNVVSADNNYFYLIKVIEDMKGQLNEVYGWYENQRNVIDPIELKMNKFDGEPINRTFKIYPEVQEEFKDFCTKHKEYKVQDVISQALYEFMQRYK